MEESTKPKETLANKDGDDKEAKNETPDKDKSVVDPQVEGGETASSLEEPENEASSGDWWSTATSSLMGSVGVLEKAVNSVSNATSSAVQVAKTKSTEVYGLVSKDLSEVSTQATNAVGTAATTVKKTLEMDWYYCSPQGYQDEETDVVIVSQKTEEDLDDKTDVMADKALEGVKKSVSSFWQYASGYAQQIFTEEDLASEAMIIKDNNPVLMDRLQAQLYALSSDPETFQTDPVEEEFKTWKCDLEKRQGEISDLMMANQTVRQHYTTMVPEKVSHKEFWTRYFFKVHLIELMETKRQALKKRAEQTRLDSDSEINWDDVGDIGSPGESSAEPIPAEMQDKLLSDYERELITRKLKKGEEAQKTLSEELDQLNVDSRNISPGSSQGKESQASDDWEKLSTGEKSPKKTSREEEGWVKT